VKLAQAYKVFDEIVAAGLEGTLRARRVNPEQMDFVVTLSLANRTEEQLTTLTAIVERYDLGLAVDDHRVATLE
jgi:hypothetical protein